LFAEQANEWLVKIGCFRFVSGRLSIKISVVIKTILQHCTKLVVSFTIFSVLLLHDMVLVLLADSEVLDIGSENKVKLLPNGKFWCFKTDTIDGKLEWIGSFATKEAALSVYYKILNGSSGLGVKEAPSLSHTGFSGPGLVRSFTVFAFHIVSDR
jgi:hypothetical protein